MRRPSIKAKQLWLMVLAAMVLIFGLWLAWFYPQSIKKADSASGEEFSRFKKQINRAVGIFKKGAPPAESDQELEDLRERVFGDTATRRE